MIDFSFGDIAADPPISTIGTVHVKNEFAKLRALRAFVPYVPLRLTRLRALRAFVPYVPSRLTYLEFYGPWAPYLLFARFTHSRYKISY